MIVIHGPDGSGKSVVANYLSEEKNWPVIWSRHQMYLSRLYVAILGFSGRKLKFYKENQVVSGSFYFTGLSKYIYVYLSFIDLNIHVFKFKRHTKEVICDRGILDRVIDVAVATMDLEICLKVFSRMLASESKDVKNIALNVNMEDAVARKEELYFDLDCRLREKYYSEAYSRLNYYVYNTSILRLADLLERVSKHDE